MSPFDKGGNDSSCLNNQLKTPAMHTSHYSQPQQNYIVPTASII